MIFRWIFRLALIVATFFAATYAAFFVLQFVWGPYLPDDPGFWESQQGLDLVTTTIGVFAASTVALKSRSLTERAVPNADS